MGIRVAFGDGPALGDEIGFCRRNRPGNTRTRSGGNRRNAFPICRFGCTNRLAGLRIVGRRPNRTRQLFVLSDGVKASEIVRPVGMEIRIKGSVMELRWHAAVGLVLVELLLAGCNLGRRSAMRLRRTGRQRHIC